jgi:hypothetical protein
MLTPDAALRFSGLCVLKLIEKENVMKVLELKIDDSIFERFKGLLELIPKNKIKVKEIYDDSNIPYVTNEEQEDIQKKLMNKQCHIVSYSKTVKI